jgi:hypothetical protein
MIELFEKEIRKKTMGAHDPVSLKLIFLKYSTSISGRGLGNKVLFFVFKRESKTPFLVVKSVRSYKDAFAIKNGYENLKSLNNLTSGSEFSAMFPQSILFYDDGTDIFNVESVCSGRKVNIGADLVKILGEYRDFSKYLLKKSDNKLKIDFNYGEKIIRALEGPKETLSGLLEYLKNLFGSTEILLPSINQHGDFTVDNILVDSGKMRIIDCDTFGNITIPGFDVFHLTTKGKISGLKNKIDSYFKELDIICVSDKKLFFIYFLHELLIKKDYILKAKSSSDIIGDFEALIDSGAIK